MARTNCQAEPTKKTTSITTKQDNSTHRSGPPKVRPVFLWSKLSSQKWEDAWIERLTAVGLSGPVISQFPNRPTIRVEVYTATEKEAEAIKEQFGGTIRKVQPSEWAFGPKRRDALRIRDSLVIVDADQEELEKSREQFAPRQVLSVPAEMAFGTGDHPTTATCLRFLADTAAAKAKDGIAWEMLDIGCGSGILAMAARVLGADGAFGFDFDPAAIRIAKENLRRNQVKKVTLIKADALQWEAPRQWPVVAANLFSTILVQAFPRIRAACAPKATLILSGILMEQVSDVFAAGQQLGFTFSLVVKRGKWVTALGTAPVD